MSFELSGSVDTPRRARTSIAEADNDHIDGLGKGVQRAALSGEVGGEMIERHDARNRRAFRDGMRRECVDDRRHRSPQPVVDEADRSATK